MKHPPAARLTLRVGVTGHRPNGLLNANEELLRARVREILEHAAGAVRQVGRSGEGLYSAEPPALRVVSALAEGADRIVAEEAVQLGWELQAPLPFPREEYERDFTSAQSREVFRSLIESEQTTAVFELDGSREDSSVYEAAGTFVIHQCDLLLAIWDGEFSTGRGGTAQIIDEALTQGLPIVCVAAARPHAIYYFPAGARRADPSFDFDELEMDICRRLGAPADIENERHYLNEGQPRWTWGAVFPAACSLILGKRPTARFRVGDYVAETDSEWESIGRAFPGLADVLAQLRARFVAHYAWADRLADNYGNRYRSSFFANYILAALAVASALIPLAFDKTEHTWTITCTALEVVWLALIVTITWRVHHYRLQDRWIEYRFLAERLRNLILLTPLGQAMPAFKVAAYAARSDPSNSWVVWHFAAIAREAGLISNRLDAMFLRRYRAFMATQLEHQVQYHQRVADQSAIVGSRLHHIATCLFALTVVAVIVHFFDHDGFLTALSAALPAFGGAIIGIAGQAEFHRVSKRSEALAESLARVLQGLRSSESAPSQTSHDLRAVAQLTAEVTQSELLDWRIVFREHPLTLPS